MAANIQELLAQYANIYSDLAQPQAAPAISSIVEARNRLAALRQLEAEELEISQERDPIASEIYSTQAQDIQEEFAGRREAALEAGQPIDQIDTEERQTLAAISTRAIQQAQEQVDAKRAKEGRKTGRAIAQELAIANTYAEPATQMVTQFEGGDPNRPSTRGLSPVDSAEITLAEQRQKAAERNLNVASRLMAAEGDAEAEEALIQDVERIQSPRMRNETMSLLLNLGFQPARPVAGVEVGEMGGGGSFAVMRDGTYRVDLPNGEVVTAASEQEAQNLIASTPAAIPEGANQQFTPEEIATRRQNFLDNTNAAIAQEQTRLNQFFGGGEVAPEPTAISSNRNTAPAGAALDKTSGPTARSGFAPLYASPVQRTTVEPTANVAASMWSTETDSANVANQLADMYLSESPSSNSSDMSRLFAPNPRLSGKSDNYVRQLGIPEEIVQRNPRTAGARTF